MSDQTQPETSRQSMAQQQREAQVAADAAQRHADIVGIVKEVIGEFLFRRSRVVLSEQHQLASLGIGRDDLAALLKLVNENLGDFSAGPIVLDLDRGFDTIASFSAAIEAQLAKAVS